MCTELIKYLIVLKFWLFLICVQVEADYGIDWDGPYGFDDLGDQAERVEVPQVRLQHPLTEENMTRLPNPNVPFMDALDIYTATRQQLIEWQPELDERE